MSKEKKRKFHNKICVLIAKIFKIKLWEWQGCPFPPPEPYNPDPNPRSILKCKICGLEILVDTLGQHKVWDGKDF